jgi:hypothetical protein
MQLEAKFGKLANAMEGEGEGGGCERSSKTFVLFVVDFDFEILIYCHKIIYK